MRENWRPIRGRGMADYEVSDLGRVRSWKRPGNTHGGRSSKPHLRKVIVAKRGYPTVMFAIDGKYVLRYTHHLVLEAFIGLRPKGTQARHLDGVCTNNKLENLCWGTASDNQRDKIQHGTYQYGESNPGAKLTDAEAIEIRKSKERLRVLSRRYGVAESTISRIRNGVRRAVY